MSFFFFCPHPFFEIVRLFLWGFVVGRGEEGGGAVKPNPARVSF
jgi:hypothetical protein